MNSRILLTAYFLLMLTNQVPGSTLQVDLRLLLNARIITTLTGDQLVPWRDALDGVTSGEATLAAARRIGAPFAQALPDDGIFSATDRHPRVELFFSNADGTGNQVRRSLAEDAYTLVPPPRAYVQFWIFVMSGNGESKLRVHLLYAAGADEVRELIVPDWYFPIRDGEAHRINLAENLGKWSSANQLMERDHHFLHGLELRPDRLRVLVGVRVEKAAPAVLTLWGATGVTQEGEG